MGASLCPRQEPCLAPWDFSAGRAGRIEQWFEGQNVAVKSWWLEEPSKCLLKNEWLSMRFKATCLEARRTQRQTSHRELLV